MNTVERWERLATTLSDSTDAAIRVQTTIWQGHLTCRIFARTDDAFVVVHDTYWNDMWTGYAVYREGVDGLVNFERTRLKSRRAVVDAVTAALDLGGVPAT